MTTEQKQDQQEPAPLTPDQFVAQAAERELNYARQHVREMHQEVERLKRTAERIVGQCNWLLTGDTSHLEEDPF